MIKRLADNLKAVRKTRWRMSQDRFAQLLDSTRSKINSYENGGVEPSIAFILKLQQLTNVSAQQLFYGHLVLEQIPPFPLEQGQTYVDDTNAIVVNESELAEVLAAQKNTQENLARIENKLGEIKTLLRT